MIRTGTAIAILLLAGVARSGDQAAGFRGEARGGYPQAGPPLRLSAAENLCWKVTLGEGCGAALVVGDRVYVQASPNALICLDKVAGRELWRREQHAGDLPKDHPAARLDASMGEVGVLQQMQRRRDRLPKDSPERAAADTEINERLQRLPADLPVLHGAGVDVVRRRSGGKQYNSAGDYLICLAPCSDGKSVVALFPTGVAVCYDLDGRLRWNYGLKPGTGKDAAVEDGVHAPAPIFADGKVVVLFRTQLVCLDGAAGALLWNAKIKSSLASPAAGRIGKETYLATGDGHIFRLRDGREVYADPKGGNHESPAAPVFAAGVFHWVSRAVRVTDGEAPVAGVLWDLAGERLAKLTGWGVASQARVGPGDMASPVVVDGRLLHYNQRQQMVTLDARTGSEVGERRTTRPVQKVTPLARGVTKNWAYGGMVLAGDYLIVAHDNGIVKVIPVKESAGPVSVSALDDDIYARPTCDGTKMFVRTLHALLCFEDRRPQTPSADPGTK